MAADPPRRKITARKDLIAIGAIVLVVCGLVAADPAGFFEWLASRKGAQVDEFLFEVVAIGAGFAVFSWRRWTELSRQIAEHKRLQTELSAINQESSSLSETDDLLQSCLSPEEAHHVVIRHFKAQLPGYSGAICVINAARDFVEVQARWGTPALSDSFFPPHDCWGLRRGRVSILRRGDANLVCAHVSKPVPSYLICVPMMAQGETLGVLCLDNGRPAEDSSEAPAEPLSESQQRMVKTLAEHLALAAANLSLRKTLHIQSVRDPLTDLFNRRHMEDSLDLELRRSLRKEMPLAVIMIDVDNFKKFNDSLGHEAGDVLLQELARIFGAQLRADDITCRYGGEEFTVVFPETSIEAARDRAEELRLKVRTSEIRYRGEALPVVTISIGIAGYPRHGSTREELLRAADRALYQAKREGRDRVVVA